VVSLRETNADGRWLHIVVPNRSGFKPQRGGLFMATNAHRSFFLFFGGAAHATTMPANLSAPNHARRMAMLIAPRRRKTKRERTICILPYKQATPLGFMLQANYRQSYVSPSTMWVITRRLRGGGA
jgi:hypothetical protein